MITVLFHLTDFDPIYGIENPRTYLNQWIQTIKAFGVEKLILIDNTEFKLSNYYTHRDSTFLFEKYNSLDEAINLYQSNSWIVLESYDILNINELNSTNLINFIHPISNVIYLFGPDFGSVSYNNINNKYPVYIQMVNQNPLYAISAVSIVLHDRISKLNN